jgi:hypothetical protein
LRADSEWPSGSRAAKREYELSPSDVDCHVTLAWGVVPMQWMGGEVDLQHIFGRCLHRPSMEGGEKSERVIVLALTDLKCGKVFRSSEFDDSAVLSTS